MCKFETLFKCTNMFFPFIFGALGVYVFIFLKPDYYFDRIERNEIKELYYSRAIMNILVSKNILSNDNYSPLFRGYKGLIGYSRNISAFNYTKFKGSYYYSVKNYSYEYLLNNTVKKNEKCPKNKRQCGYLRKDLIVCLRNDEECPINDIKIDAQSSYTYKTIIYENILSFDNNYIHFTNKRTDNYILFDLLFSIKHPLSKIELLNSEYKDIFQLHEGEKQWYFSGKIDKINVYKQLDTTKITLKDLLTEYGTLKTFQDYPNYKTNYFNSTIFIYKKYALPFSITLEQVDLINNDINKLLLYLSFVLIFLTFAPSTGADTINSFNYAVLIYVIISLIHLLIIFLFFFNWKIIMNSGFLANFSDKNKFRIRVILLRIFYVVLAIVQNIMIIFELRKVCDKYGYYYEPKKKDLKKELKETKEAPLIPINNKE